VIILFDVALVVDFNNHIFVPVIEKPCYHILNTACDCQFIFKILILPEIKQSQYDNHVKIVCFGQYPFQSAHKFRAKFPVSRIRTIDPVFLIAITNGTTSLKIDGK
jgi:hypothetical protein